MTALTVTSGCSLLVSFDEYGPPDGGSTSSPTPYSGKPVALPGMIHAPEYDYGGEGVAYHDDDPKNQLSTAFRPNEGVDTDGSIVGWIQQGEWLDYTGEAASPGTYSVS